MAKQNFLSGGFYGKLGMTVGQRWKNIRTLRTYVIPANPRTPEQQANRNFFKSAVPFAQKAMSMNKGCPAWDTTANTEWAQKMSLAKTNLENNFQNLEVIPLVPTGFISSYTITNIELDTITPNTSVKFVLTGTLPTAAKSYSVMFYFADGSREGEYLLLKGTTTAADPTLLTCPCLDTTDFATATIYALLCSTDDVDDTTVTYSARLEVERSSLPAFEQTMTVTSVASNGNGGYNITLQMGVYGADLVGTFEFSTISATGYYQKKAERYNLEDMTTAPQYDAADIIWLITNWTVNNTTGIITFTATPDDYRIIDKYTISQLAVSMRWTDAYTSATSISSGTCSANNSSIPQYTQPQIYSDALEHINEIFVEENVEYGVANCYVYPDITYPNLLDILEELHGTDFSISVSPTTNNGSAVVDGTTRRLDFSPSNSYAEVDGDQLTILALMDTIGQEEPNATITSGSWNSFTINITKEGNTAIPTRIYDDTHRIGEMPTYYVNASTSFEIEE